MSSRRLFLKAAVGGAAIGVVGTLMPAEVSAADLLYLLDSLGPMANPAYRVSISGPTQLLVKGQRYTITGQILTSSGTAYANQTIGVYDGLQYVCSQTKTDSKGNINYPVTVRTADAAVVEFWLGNNRYPFVFQSVTDLFTKKTNSLYVSGIAFKNASSSDLKCITTVDNRSIKYTHRIGRNQTVTTVRTTQSKPRVTWYAGGSFNVGALIAGGSLSVTVDNNYVATTTLTLGGMGVIRGSVYGTTQGDIGVCWAPGADLGVTPVSLSGELALCYGTDGPSLGASGSAGGATGGFSAQLSK